MSIYGSDWTQYDVFRYSPIFCRECCTPCESNGKCLCCGFDNSTLHSLHIASEIYHNWQLEYCRGWKWNNTHRRGIDIHGFRPVQIHHVSVFPNTEMYGRLVFLNNKQINLAIIITKVLRQRKKEKYSQQRRSRLWYRNWVIASDESSNNVTYDKWMNERPRGKFLSYAIEEGLTYRHLRVYGYKPYIQESIDLNNETIEIFLRASARMM